MGNLRDRLLAGLIKSGTIDVELPGGRRLTAGRGSGPKLGLRFNDKTAPVLFLLDPELRFGELYMEGRIDITEGTLFDVMMLGGSNMWQRDASLRVRLWQKVRSALRHIVRPNDPLRARRNVAHHYDLDARFYMRFLDSGMQYSCAYFDAPGQNLEKAQLAKKRHIGAKLLIEPGQRVLDIGCGFGGLAIYLAQFCGAQVTGVTLSRTQIGVAKSGAADLGLSGATDFQLCDYRELQGRFDRIVSVGMFEHVGLAHYPEFFRKIAALLDKDGVALLHTIGRLDGPCATNPWVAKYIFPGGYMPALSEILPAIERAGLYVTDLEVLRLHYAETIKAWRERFAARRDEVKASHGERFCRMWEFYLAGSETAFRCGGLGVFQIQLAKRLDAVPLTRDYIARTESFLRERDSAAAQLRLAGE